MATTTEIVKAAPAAVEPAETTDAGLVGMLERLAANPAVDVAKLERLIAMQEQILDRNARAAFDAAFAAMQVEIPTIAEKGRTDKTTYALLEDIVEQVRPILHRHGFSLTHRTEFPAAKAVRVVGILTHAGGHKRESEFLAEADNTGSKNAIQALGSTNAYGRRYTTYDLLGITTRKADDDGQRGGRAAAEQAAPEGFEDWIADMEATAEEGTAKLQETWIASRKDFRGFTVKARRQEWDRIKRIAARVDEKGGPK